MVLTKESYEKKLWLPKKEIFIYRNEHLWLTSHISLIFFYFTFKVDWQNEKNRTIYTFIV